MDHIEGTMTENGELRIVKMLDGYRGLEFKVIWDGLRYNMKQMKDVTKVAMAGEKFCEKEAAT